MNLINKAFFIVISFLLAASCSVISREVKKESGPPVPFEKLSQEADRYIGKTIIIGGYILELKPKTENPGSEVTLEVLSAPLSYWDEPKAMFLAEGRLLIKHRHYLDPEKYRKGRKITVAGILKGCKSGKVKTCEIESREIYLWPENYEYLPHDYALDARHWEEDVFRNRERSLDRIYQTLPRPER
ncbi:Slp family lipoprotein [Thermodesulfobacteriota bacterium]